MKSTKGFTLIELIVVMILISILSALGIGLLSGPDQYAARLASDRWLAGLRLAQRLALQKQNSANLVAITVSDSADVWTMSIDQGAVNLSEFEIEKERLLAHTSTTEFADPCSTLSSLASLTLNFDGYGNSVSAARVQSATNRRLCFVGAQTMELCISPSGYTYEGLCEN
jgi:MSHA pilin protein MshC